MKSLSRRISLVFLLILISASCAHSDRRVEGITVAPTVNDNPDQQISELEKQINEARNQDVPFLSPTWFESAQNSLNEAKGYREKGGDSMRDLYLSVAQGKAQIQRAREITSTSQRELADVLSARKEALQTLQKAQSAGATQLGSLKKDLADTDEKLVNLTTAIEEDNPAKAQKNKPEVYQAYLAFRYRAIQKEKLDEADRIVEEAIHQDAKKFAPKTLAEAQAAIDGTYKYIKANPDQTDDINQRSANALFLANRTLMVTQQSKSFAERKPEDTVLWVENNIERLSKDLGIPGQKNKNLESQFAVLFERTNKLKRENSQIAGLEEQALEGMAATRARQNFEAIKKQFKSNEAEVSSTGDKIIIRLKGVQFPSGESRLSSENFALLQKVQLALAKFPKAKIDVEGHTDAAGSQQKNLDLSQKRAETVKEYFVSNGEIPEDQISARGYGFSKPIAPNKTKQDRAMNRRIDVVINLTGADTSAAE